MPKILVVDDEVDTVELITFNLRAAGFEVIAAGDGAEAINMARTAAPSLIVLDIMLPEMDGLEVCRHLRRDPLTYALPIILLTALSGELSRIIGHESGASEYMTKPFSPRELVSRVTKLLQVTPTGWSF